jgi:hypothetical protein
MPNSRLWSQAFKVRRLDVPRNVGALIAVPQLGQNVWAGVLYSSCDLHFHDVAVSIERLKIQIY